MNSIITGLPLRPFEIGIALPIPKGTQWSDEAVGHRLYSECASAVARIEIPGFYLHQTTFPHLGIMRQWPSRAFCRAMLNGGEENKWPFHSKDTTQKHPWRTFLRDATHYVPKDWNPIAFLSTPMTGVRIRNLQEAQSALDLWMGRLDLTPAGHSRMQVAAMPPQVSGRVANFKAPPPGCTVPPSFPFKSLPPPRRPPGLEENLPTQNQTGPAGSSSGQPVLVNVPSETEETVVEDYTMVDVDQTPSQNEPTISYECQASGRLNPEILPTMPPQPKDSSNRPYGQLQFREMFEMYVKHWNEGQTRTKTLMILRSLCETAIQEDIMMMFETHAVYFFEETTLPTNSHESEFERVQLGIMNGEIAPANLTDV